MDALNEHPGRPLAIAMLPGTGAGRHGPQGRSCADALEAEELLFFDARSHPLGDARLTIARAHRPGTRVQ